jgi:hypothetical protein
MIVEKNLEKFVASIDERGDIMGSLDGERVYWPSVSMYYTSVELRRIADELDRRPGRWDVMQTHSAKTSFDDDMRGELL